MDVDERRKRLERLLKTTKEKAIKETDNTWILFIEKRIEDLRNKSSENCLESYCLEITIGVLEDLLKTKNG